MTANLKHPDITLPEVRKPAGYGTLIAVIPTGKTHHRELWFQNGTIVRCVIVGETFENNNGLTIQTKAGRKKKGT